MFNSSDVIIHILIQYNSKSNKNINYYYYSLILSILNSNYYFKHIPREYAYYLLEKLY